jgi:hypothetical protein
MVTKKGELTSQQLITIVILIISFVIILAFFFMLDIGGKIDEESCRNSVMMRGALPVGSSLIDLKCKTKEICFSMGGKCNVKTKDFREIKVKDKSEITLEMMGLMASCWSMMGEGKVAYASNGECAVCYKIYFDDKIKADNEMNSGIPYSQFYNYMTRKMPQKEISYLYYLYKMSDAQTVANYILVHTGDTKKSTGNLDINTEIITPNKEYAIVTRFQKDEQVPPMLIGFSADELKSKAQCSGYSIEV